MHRTYLVNSFEAEVKQTSAEIKCLNPTASMCEMCTLSVSSKVVYHNFLHDTAS